jgi:hypothetical protein
MLRVKSEYLSAIASATSVEELWPNVQAAIELEHSTIPPYLTAMFSLKPETNGAARDVISSVVREEMLHMTISANLLNAIGGAPKIDRPGFIPNYPGKLPMLIDDGLVVGLRKVTRDLVYNVFMRIEEPENPIDMVIKPPADDKGMILVAAAKSSKDYATIGEFYRALKRSLQDIGVPAFAKPSFPQVVDNDWFTPDELFPITNLDTALRAIDIIVEQGEGTASSPFEHGPDSKPAHYYRFAEIVNGRYIKRDPAEAHGYSYSGPEVSLDPEGVWDLYPDPKECDYQKGSRAHALVSRFNFSYTALLRALHAAFNGYPENLKTAMGVMYELRLLGGEIVATPVGKTGYMASPSFEYATELRP